MKFQSAPTRTSSSPPRESRKLNNSFLPVQMLLLPAAVSTKRTSREQQETSNEDNESTLNIRGGCLSRPASSQVKVVREKSSNLETPDTVVAKYQPTRLVERKPATDSSDFSPIRQLKDIDNSKSSPICVLLCASYILTI